MVLATGLSSVAQGPPVGCQTQVPSGGLHSGQRAQVRPLERLLTGQLIFLPLLNWAHGLSSLHQGLFVTLETDRVSSGLLKTLLTFLLL